MPKNSCDFCFVLCIYKHTMPSSKRACSLLVYVSECPVEKFHFSCRYSKSKTGPKAYRQISAHFGVGSWCMCMNVIYKNEFKFVWYTLKIYVHFYKRTPVMSNVYDTVPQVNHKHSNCTFLLDKYTLTVHLSLWLGIFLFFNFLKNVFQDFLKMFPIF